MSRDLKHGRTLQSLTSAFWDLLFPPRCAGCGRLGAWLCANCVAQIPMRKAATCVGCGFPVENPRAHAICRQGGPLAGLLAMAAYAPPLKPAIHLFKYRFVADVGVVLGGHLADFARGKLPPGEILIAPVPLHKDRLRWRGFNQSAVLARRVAGVLGLPCDEGLLARDVATVPQVELQAGTRRANVRGAFRCTDRTKTEGRTVVVVDDVATTLATLEECARTLRAAGAGEVWGLVLAQD